MKSSENRWIKLSFLAVALSLILGGCSYKQRDTGFGKMGYTETKTKDGSYMLSYYGSAFDDEKDVQVKWNKRAKELCGHNNYKANLEKKEWSYDNYSILPPLLFKTKGASPLIEGKLMCD
jgi:hypothetical protein